jgi:ABC-2 type transport system ATP-binding protein
LIDTENLTKKFGNLIAVENLTLHVDEGEVFGFLGPNGAGKTTTIRMLCCLISKTGGMAKIGDYEIGNVGDQQKIRRIIGLLPENVGLYDDLSAYKNLDYYGQFYRLAEEQRKERIKYFLEMLGLWEKRDVAAGTLSKGMKQKLAIARALIHDPKVLFLDEPTANLDPEASKIVRDFILELKKEKRTIFLNTHNLDEAQKICDRVGILKTRLIATGTMDKLSQSLVGRRTIVQVSLVNDAIIAAIKKLGLANIEIAGNRLTIDVRDFEKDNSDIVDAIIAAGGHVQSITSVSPSLEEIYLKLVRD